MKKLIFLVALAISPVAGAQLAAPVAFTGHYTADIGCVEIPNAVVDGWLAAQAPYLKRGSTFTSPGTHPLCPLYLHYDDIASGGVTIPLDVNEVNHYLIDLKPRTGFTCNNAFGIQLPAGPVAFFPVMHESDVNFVAQARVVFGYNAWVATFARNHNPVATSVTASDLVGSPVSLAATYYSRVALNATGTANLAHMSAALNAPVFGNKATGPSWSQVNWNATVGNTLSENAVMLLTSSYLPTPVMLSNAPGLNIRPGGFMHFEHVPFESTIPVDCQ